MYSPLGAAPVGEQVSQLTQHAPWRGVLAQMANQRVHLALAEIAGCDLGVEVTQHRGLFGVHGRGTLRGYGPGTGCVNAPAQASMDSRIPVVVRMRVECARCRHTEDETFEFDMPFAKSQPMEAYEPGKCSECGGPIHMHLKRTQQRQ